MANLLFFNVERGHRRPRKFRLSNNSLIDDYTDEELRARYRFGRQSILYITNLLARDLRRSTARNHALTPLHQVLIALRFFASGSFLQVIGDTVGVDKSTVSRAVSDVARALAAKQEMFIKWPTTNAELVENKNAFYRRGGFPTVIGFFLPFCVALLPKRQFRGKPFRCQNKRRVLWDAIRGLAAFNPRLTNLTTNRALSNALLTPG